MRKLFLFVFGFATIGFLGFLYKKSKKMEIYRVETDEYRIISNTIDADSIIEKEYRPDIEFVYHVHKVSAQKLDTFKKGLIPWLLFTVPDLVILEDKKIPNFKFFCSKYLVSEITDEKSIVEQRTIIANLIN